MSWLDRYTIKVPSGESRPATPVTDGFPRAVPIGADGMPIVDYKPPPARETIDSAIPGVAQAVGTVAQSKTGLAKRFRPSGAVSVMVDPLRVSWWAEPATDPAIEALLATGRAGDVVAALQRRRALSSELNSRDRIAREALSRYRAPNAPTFVEAIDTGLALSNAATNIGGGFGPIATAATGIGGFVAGVVAGAIPFARNEAESQWRGLCGSLQAIDRYAVAANMEPAARAAYNAEGLSLPSFRWATDPWGGHSPYGGPVGRIVALVEIMLEFPLIPELSFDNEREKRLVALYVACFVAGAHDDDKPLSAMRALYPRLADGRIAPGLQGFMQGWSNQAIGAIRAEARSVGITSIFNPPITPSIERALQS